MNRRFFVRRAGLGLGWCVLHRNARTVKGHPVDALVAIKNTRRQARSLAQRLSSGDNGRFTDTLVKEDPS